jgi:hypothetical protein
MKKNKTSFAETKAEIIRRAQEKGACSPQVQRVQNAETDDELLQVIKDNFRWCITNNLFADSELIGWFENLESFHIHVNKKETILAFNEGENVLILWNSTVNVKSDGSSTVNVESYDSSTVNVESYNSSTVNVKSYGASTVNVKSYGASTVNVKSYGSSTVNVKSYGASTVNVESYGSSTVNVKSYGASTVKAEIKENSLIRDRRNNRVYFRGESSLIVRNTNENEVIEDFN